MFTFLGRYFCPTEQLIILKPRTKQNLPEKVTKLNSPYSARGETWILIKKSKEDWLEACFDTVSCNLKHWCFHNEFVLWSGFFYLYIYNTCLQTNKSSSSIFKVKCIDPETYIMYCHSDHTKGNAKVTHARSLVLTITKYLLFIFRYKIILQVVSSFSKLRWLFLHHYLTLHNS